MILVLVCRDDDIKMRFTFAAVANGITNMFDDSGHELRIASERSAVDQYLERLLTRAWEGDQEAIAKALTVHAHASAILVWAVRRYHRGRRSHTSGFVPSRFLRCCFFLGRHVKPRS